MVSKEDLAWRGINPTVQQLDPRYTLHRVTNIVFIVCHFAAMICHIICFSVLLSKHQEIKDKLDYHGGSKICILYMGHDSDTNEVEFNGEHTCDFVIVGSIILTVLAVLSQLGLLIRTVLMRK